MWLYCQYNLYSLYMMYNRRVVDHWYRVTVSPSGTKCNLMY